MNYIFLYLRWSSLLFLVLSRLLGFTDGFIRIPLQLLLSIFYIVAIYNILERNEQTYGYYEDLKHCIIGISWACFFIFDIIRSLISLEFLNFLPIDIIYIGVLLYTMYSKEDNTNLYIGFLCLYLFLFLLQDSKKQTIVYKIMRDIFFYISYCISLYLFDVESKIESKRKDEIINSMLKTVICSIWILLFFLSQFFFPLYLISVVIREIYLNEDKKQTPISVLPVTTKDKNSDIINLSELTFANKQRRKQK